MNKILFIFTQHDDDITIYSKMRVIEVSQLGLNTYSQEYENFISFDTSFVYRNTTKHIHSPKI